MSTWLLFAGCTGGDAPKDDAPAVGTPSDTETSTPTHDTPTHDTEDTETTPETPPEDVGVTDLGWDLNADVMLRLQNVEVEDEELRKRVRYRL